MKICDRRNCHAVAWALAVSALALAFYMPVLSSLVPQHCLPPALALGNSAQCQTLSGKAITLEGLEKYKAITITVKDDNKESTYSGVPLRTLLTDMVRDIKLEKMPEWKALSRREIIMEFTGNDGYPGLVTAIEIAINKDGDRFILATHKDGKLIEGGAQLHAQWIRRALAGSGKW